MSGNSLYVLDADFNIPAAKFDEAFAAVKRWYEESYGEPVDPDVAGSFYLTMGHAFWSIQRDGNGGVGAISFDGDFWDDTYDALMEALAPFVTDGSYIECDDGESHWRWVFRDGKASEVRPNITWPETPAVTAAADDEAAAYSLVQTARRRFAWVGAEFGRMDLPPGLTGEQAAKVMGSPEWRRIEDRLVEVGNEQVEQVLAELGMPQWGQEKTVPGDDEEKT